MFEFDKMFDFNGDGELDELERATQLYVMDEMLKESSSFDYSDDDRDVFGDVDFDSDDEDF